MIGSSNQTAAESGPIALLVNTLSSGGAQQRIATLANRLAELGRAVDIVSFDADGPMRGMLSPGVNIVPVAANGLAFYLDRARPAVLMSCVTDTHRAAGLPAATRRPACRWFCGQAGTPVAAIRAGAC